ncbi:MAG: triose-phosphate isomerase [Deltaproteobacteria bacterium]|jgi:triosephosphate isomerase|nr:triose-phosphate isomerase [Deltaproteobacteria bacterium]MBW2531070.1 triose-phosphate isomerase [Deltaproteobacteria bacterium]
MRKPLIAGNWKLNLGPAAATSLSEYLVREIEGLGDVDVLVFPTALSIPAVVQSLAGSAIAVGVQEVAGVASGALTGANSAVMAREAGCTWMLTGHSERRQHFGETDQGVQAKVQAGLAAGLQVMICIGETLEERRAGKVDEVTQRQLAVALEGLDDAALARVAIAYEPVWAIGTGVTATVDQAQEVHAALRGWLDGRRSATVAARTRILYGGSVNAKNAQELLDCQDVDGALVGGASLNVGSFADIVLAA